jgi:hypothetical protein
VNTGALEGADAQVANIRAVAEVGIERMWSTVVATRGPAASHEEFSGDVLNVIEIAANDQLASAALYDIDDIDAAFDELDKRYLAGEAAAHARPWSAITSIHTLSNHDGVLPTDWVTVDHRRATPFASGELNDVIGSANDLTPDLRAQIETVHRLDRFVAVVTNVRTESRTTGFAPSGG